MLFFLQKATLRDTSKPADGGRAVFQRLGRCSMGLCHAPRVRSGLGRAEAQHPCGWGEVVTEVPGASGACPQFLLCFQATVTIS